MTRAAVAICAPSGVGKTTVARRLVGASDDLTFSVSATTRPARAGESDGVDYCFVSRGTFERMIERGELLEWAEVHGELYGTPRGNLEEAQREGKRLILDIDVQGARQLVEAVPDCMTIFLLPPSFETLIERLKGRRSENPERLRQRLLTAKSELEAVGEFRFVVVNDRLEDTVADIQSIIRGEGEPSTIDKHVAEALSRDLLAALAAHGAQ